MERRNFLAILMAGATVALTAPGARALTSVTAAPAGTVSAPATEHGVATEKDLESARIEQAHWRRRRWRRWRRWRRRYWYWRPRYYYWRPRYYWWW